MNDMINAPKRWLGLKHQQASNLASNANLVWTNRRKWLFFILFLVFSVNTAVDAMTTRIHQHARIADVQNNDVTRRIKVNIPINPEAPVGERKYVGETFDNYARWTDASFDPYVIETIANTAKLNDMDVTVQISWSLFDSDSRNLNNIFVADDKDGLIDAVIAQRYSFWRFFKPDNYLRNGGNTAYPWLVTYGIMALAWLLCVTLSWLLIYKGPGWFLRGLKGLWSLLTNYNWRSTKLGKN